MTVRVRSAMNSSDVSNCTPCDDEKSIDSSRDPGQIFRVLFPLSVMIVGVPGNCLILGVYWSKPRKTTTNLLIMALAWADLFTCLLLIYFIGPSLTILLGKQPSEAFLYLRYGLYSAVSSSVLITTLIAFDRYDCVCRLYRRLLNPRKILAALVLVVLSALIFNLPYIAIAADNANKVPYAFIVLSASTFWYIVTVTMIAVCYCKVYKTIRKHVKVDILQTPDGFAPNPPAVPLFPTGKQIQHSSQQGDIAVETITNVSVSTTPLCDTLPEPSRAASKALQRKTTRMLLLASLVLLISWLPYSIYLVLVFTKYFGNAIPDEAVAGFYHTSLVLYINHAINPLIYGLANMRFRQDCKHLLSNLPCR
ncbi:gastrin/cholecystokinin type B receptor-like [Acanthaster planci]|uniref:Gastrin/cholecystokinin type B receptor-like n=1 Tax=Acanthaster planci TaxID=133434 RepID=A0A8B7ZBX4_ACAPL|nr:gastrin/cholecystokinin type B receptor-like [Acanthaster planci]